MTAKQLVVAIAKLHWKIIWAIMRFNYVIVATLCRFLLALMRGDPRYQHSRPRSSSRATLEDVKHLQTVNFESDVTG